jgi:hypothetical protein
VSDAEDPPTPALVPHLVGFATFIAFIGIDATSAEWNPDPWSYLSCLLGILWGPQIVRAMRR